MRMPQEAEATEGRLWFHRNAMPLPPPVFLFVAQMDAIWKKRILESRAVRPR